MICRLFSAGCGEVASAFSELCEFGCGGGEGFLFFAESKTQDGFAVGGIAEEAGARHGRDADFFDQIFGEREIVWKAEGGDVRHDVVCAARFEAAESGIGQNSQQAFAADRKSVV